MTGNPFPFSDTNKRYHTFDYYVRHTFGCKVAKVPLDAGFTCPNRDGTCGFGGCTYCSSRGAGDFASLADISLKEQYRQGRQLMAKWQGKYIAYLQAYTNTYGSPERLRRLYEEALALPDCVGLSIATRADCLSPAVVELLRELDGRIHLEIELGLQTVHDATARRIHRGHDFASFLAGYRSLAGLRVTVHLMNYLPGESYAMMLESARVVGALAPHGVKIHLLYLLKGTVMEEEYSRSPWHLPTAEEYASLVADQLELLPPQTVIGRLTGDGPRSLVTAPHLPGGKIFLLNAIDKELACRDSFQGKFVHI